MKAGKGAAAADSGEEDPEHSFEDENGTIIKVLEARGGSATSTWEKAKAVFREKLEAEEGGKLNKTSLEFLNEVVTPQQAIAQCEKTKERADKEYSSKKEVVVAGKKLNIKEKMVKILRKMNMFVAIGDVVFEHSPDTSAVVWSAVRLILEIALDDINTCGLLIDAVDEITGAMFAAEVYEQRYHKAELENEKTNKNEAFFLGSKVFEKIVPLYADILYFSYYSKKYIQHGKLVRLLKGVTKPIAILQGILDGITKKLGDMHTVAGLVFQEQSLEALEGLATTTKFQGEETRNFIKEAMFKSNRDITDLKDAVLRNLANEEKERLNAEFLENEKWLDPLHDPYFELNSNRSKRQKGTCGWIFDQEEYKQWYTSAGSSMLWVYGNAGFGKSVLMSAIVDSILDDVQKKAPARAEESVPPPVVASFFCKVGSEKTQKTVSILKNIIYQYYQHCRQQLSQEVFAEANSRIKEVAVKEAGIANTSSLNFANNSAQETWQKLIIDLGKLINNTSYIIIDALDECDDREKTSFLSLLQKIAESASRIRVIVTSRQEPDIVTTLSHGPKISVEEQKNIKDVKVYVKKELQKVTILKEKERADARKVIVKRAAGMFRYAALAIQSLQQPWARPLSKHLKNLPDQMAEFYQRSLDQMDSQQKEVLITALRWAICADGDITVQQIAEDFSNVFLEEEEDKIPISEVEDGEDDNEDQEVGDSDDSDSDSDSDSDDDGNSGSDGASGEDKDTANKASQNHGLANSAALVPGADAALASDIKGRSSNEGANGVEGTSRYSESELKARLRQPMEHVKNSRGIFFYVGDDDIVRLTHTTVRDFVEDNAKKYMEESSKLVSCHKCLEELEKSSTLRCAPKWGHLLMALKIVRHLNCPEFQERYMSWDQYWNGGDEVSPLETIETEPGQNDEEKPGDEGTQNIQELEANPTDPGPGEETTIVEGQAEIGGDIPEPEAKCSPEPTPIINTETTGSESGDALTVTNGNVQDTNDQNNHNEEDAHAEAIVSWAPSEADSDYQAPGAGYIAPEMTEDTSRKLRYEIQHWIGHVAQAEKLWTKEEKQKSKEWQELIAELKKLALDKRVFHFIQRHVFSTNWDPWTKTTGYGNPLCVFSWNEAPSVVEELLKDADKDEINYTFPGGNMEYRSALQFAIEGTSPEIVKMLIDAGADLNWKNHTGKTTIDFACSPEILYFDNLKIFLESGGDAIQAHMEGERRTAFHNAVYRGLLDVAKLLLKHGARINARDPWGETPLHWALYAPIETRKEIVTLLIENGADLNMQDNQGQAPLYEAASMGHLEMLELLVKHGADVNTAVQYDKFMKWNLLHAAVGREREGDDPSINGLGACLFLIENGVDLMHQDFNGETPLQLAVRQGYTNFVRNLLPKYIEKDPSRAFLRLRDHKERTILHRAAAGRDLEMVEQLLDSCNNPAELLGLKERSGSTPIFPAAYRGNSEIVQYLIHKGADITLTNKHGSRLMSRAIDGLWQLEGACPTESRGRDRTIAALIKADPERYKTDYSIVILMLLLKSEIIFNALLDVGLDFSLLDEFNWSWVMHALAYGFGRELLHSKGITLPEVPTSIPLPGEEWRGGLPSRFVVSTSVPPEAYRLDEMGTTLETLDRTSRSFATDKPIPFGKFQYYYEAEIFPVMEDDSPISADIYFGFVQDNPNLGSGQIGWEYSKYSRSSLSQEHLHGEAYQKTGLHGHAWGWNLTDGRAYHRYGRGDNSVFNLPFSLGCDSPTSYTIGCGFDSEGKRIWFTRDGEFLGIGFLDVAGRLWPTVGFTAPSAKVEFNLGADTSRKPFKYDYRNRFASDVARWVKANDRASAIRGGGAWGETEWVDYLRKHDPDFKEGLFLAASISNAATIPHPRLIRREVEAFQGTTSQSYEFQISDKIQQLSKRSPAPPPYPLGGSNENSFDDLDPRGNRRADNQDDVDEGSNGPWNMFGNMSPGALDTLRTDANLVQNPPPQNMGMGLGLMVPRPVVNAVGGNAPQLGPQNNDSGTEVEEEEEDVTENEEEEKEVTEIEEEETANTEFEEEEKENTEIEEEEKEGTENNEEDALESSQGSRQSQIASGQAIFITQPQDYLLPEFQSPLIELNRNPSLLRSPSVNSGGGGIAASSNGGRSRSSPTRVGLRNSGLFGNFDPSTLRDDSGNRQYGRNRNRRQSFSSPTSDLLDFGGNSLMSRLNSGEGPLMRPVTLNFGHDNPYPMNSNQQTNQGTTNNQGFIADDLFSQVSDDNFPPPRSLVNQPQRNDQPAPGTTLVDITGGLGGPPVYREEAKEGSDSGNLDSGSA
ncbi:hypothetical protein TWF730_005115 [Orbilia blumenaviensis]|uniref:B30.2/SPRY domain-containing protein n=1 Tax=Orbilia blumenaviensis TaxID=1796055 RepID=A0AAV9VKN0_9PEZI